PSRSGRRRKRPEHVGSGKTRITSMSFVTRSTFSSASPRGPLMDCRATRSSASRALLVVTTCLGMAGCQSARIAEQGIGLHEALVKMYDDQVWDSLIRAKQNRPFVLLNYTELFGQDAEQVSANGGGGKLVPSLSGAETGWFVAGSVGR